MTIFLVPLRRNASFQRDGHQIQVLVTLKKKQVLPIGSQALGGFILRRDYEGCFSRLAEFSDIDVVITRFPGGAKEHFFSIRAPDGKVRISLVNRDRLQFLRHCAGIELE